MTPEMRADVIVVGGGHAGTEAAAAAARMGARTLLLTHRLETVGVMSCNPSIGGIGKGHLVREVDAFDGVMGRAADRAGIHFKLLNRRKGPAVRGPRAQADRRLYREAVQAILAATPNLTVLADAVEDIIVSSGGAVSGVLGASGRVYRAGAVVLTAGTFLRGVIHIGHEQFPAGRVGEAPAGALASRLAELRLPLGRLKTGTPPRLSRRSIDWESLPADPGDEAPEPFSTMTDAITLPQVVCRITGTTSETHRLVRENLGQSAVYGGAISGLGPRYCPSIEDKVVRFPERDRHQIFLEPEGLDVDTVYPNGISTSFPAALQAAIVATLPGLERAQITQPGYAVEYDFVDPRALSASLELRAIPGFFLAGQVNGTTGYEEAAAQGVLAGINAAGLASGGTPVVLDRAGSYIGVLIDDLTTRGVTEPYRMFTSRAEFRLRLRCDNADVRLTGLGMRVGCVGAARASRFTAYEAELQDALAGARVRDRTTAELVQAGLSARSDGGARSLLDVLSAGADPSALARLWPWYGGLSRRVQDQLEVEALYAGFFARQDGEIRQMRAADARPLPRDIDYESVHGLSRELRQRLGETRPGSLGALGRIPGVTPAAVVAVIGHMRRLSAA